MSDALKFEDGTIALGGVTLGGILKSLSVRGSVVFDEVKQDGVSGKRKMAMGYNDADLSVTIELLTDDTSTCYDKLESLDAVFKDVDNKGMPLVYDVLNRHAGARRINQVVFSSLDTSESDQDDVILASLNFVEHKPAIIKVEQQANMQDEQSLPETSVKEPEPESSIMVDLRD